MNTNKILVVVDMQNDFITGVLGNESTKSIVNNVKNLVEEFIKEECPIIFTKDTHTNLHYPVCREGKHLPIKHCIIGTEGSHIIPELSEALEYSNTYVLNKIDSFGFFNLHELFETTIDSKKFPYNRFGEYEIHICGVVTNMCVLAVALSFQNLFINSEIYIHSNCCESNDPILHDEALHVMQGMHMNII